jgi:hypothetical protein
VRAGWRSAAVWLLPLWAAAQSPVLELQVLAGEGARHALGSRAAKFLIIKVTDDLGKPIPGALVSFLLPEEGPGGVFSNGLHTEVVSAAADGTAVAPPVRWNQLPGDFEIRVVAATEQSRAGTVVPMHLSAGEDAAAETVASNPANHVKLRPKGGHRWLVVGLVAAGAAGIGFSTGWLKGPRREAPKGTEPPRIGPPVISIGRP